MATNPENLPVPAPYGLKVDGTPKKANRGRKLLCTPEIVAKIAAHVRVGNFWETAAALAGVSKSTFWGWIKIAREAQHPPAVLTELLESLTREEGTAEALHVQNLMTWRGRDWRASAFFLERKHRDRWGKVERVEQRNVDKNDNDVPAGGVLLMPIVASEDDFLEQARLFENVQKRLIDGDKSDGNGSGGSDT